MPSIRLALLVSLLLVVPLVSASRWPVERYASSVKAIYTEAGGQCSSVLVGKNGIYLTDAHCLEGVDAVTIEGLTAKILARSTDDDLAVFQSSPWGRPLVPAANEPRPGDEILQLGFGYDSAVVIPLPSTWIGRPARDAKPVHASGSLKGMSGGPVINRRGELVGLVRGTYQLPSQPVSDMVELRAIREAVKTWAR